ATTRVQPPPVDSARNFASAIGAITQAHESFLRFTASTQRAMHETLQLQQAVLERLLMTPGEFTRPGTSTAQAIFLDRPKCLEFAVGKSGPVLGPEWAEVDAPPTRVRLPDEPLMLVDRIVSIEGEPHSLTCGRIVTEHDVHSERWYLDNGV